MAERFSKFNLWLHGYWERHSLKISIILFLIAFLFVYLANSIFIIIEAGHAGVLYRRFWGGTQTNQVYGEGLQIIAPFNSMNIYEVRLQQAERTFSVICSNGLNVDVTLSIRYRPKIEFLGVLHKEVGPDYLTKVIVPEVQALVRKVFGQYSPDELYTTKRSVAQEILQGALDEIAEEYVLLDDLLVETITLPPVIQAAIQAKLTEEQRVFEMKYRIERERQEAERKTIEAGGVSSFQQTVSQTLTESLLKYKGIEATLELAKSDNAKIVVIGNPNGLPVIYDSTFSESGAFKARASTNQVQSKPVLKIP